jgi:putative FmdB family regulatory protein
MPTYSYRCATCDNRFDAFQKFADDPLTVCPECGGLVKRVIQPVGVVFKGSGWYINDSRKAPVESSTDSSNSSPSSKSTDSTATDKPKGKDAKDSTEAKPAAAAKPEAKPAPAAAD